MALNFKSVVTYTHPSLGQQVSTHFYKTKAAAQKRVDLLHKSLGYPIIGSHVQERDENGKFK
jgi:hypothetical protein